MANLSKPVSWLLRLSILAVVVFVAWNVWQSRTLETVDQSSVANEMIGNATGLDSEDRAVQRAGGFSGRNGYAAGGGVSIIGTVNDQPVLKFSDDFSASNGPDLVVWLSPNRYGSGEELGKVVSLGALKELRGGQLYNLPDDADRYKSVVIWCRAFDVAFGVADLE